MSTNSIESSQSKIDSYENAFKKATLDQSCIDEKANLIPFDRWAQTVQDITIVDAKESGIKREDIRKIISNIASKELEGSKGVFNPECYVEDEYFEGPERSRLSLMPEAILLAKNANKFIGFIITSAKSQHHKTECNVPDNTSFVSYIAVDSAAKRAGVGTKLMLAAMLKTKQLGNQYLAVEYIAVGLGVDKKIGETRIEFYNSFSKRFGIPKKVGQHILSSRKLHVFPYYDLKNFDFRANALITPVVCKNLANKITSKKSSCYIFSAVCTVAVIILGLGMRALTKSLPM